MVISELTKQDVEVHWTEDKQSVHLQVSSKLNKLSYRWEFQLNRLTDELVCKLVEKSFYKVVG